MQLTCANCAARYLVDPAAIGPTGRTVQCFRCGHKWLASLPPPVAVGDPDEMPEPVAATVPDKMPEPVAATVPDKMPESPPVRTPVPDVIIRPPSQFATSYLPAIPVDPGMPIWLKTAIAALVLFALAGGAGYLLLRDHLAATLAIDLRTATISHTTALDGKATIVIAADIVNTGHDDAEAKRLRVVFRDAQGKPVGERIIDIATGRIPPRGRARFEAQLEDTPATSAAVGVTAE